MADATRDGRKILDLNNNGDGAGAVVGGVISYGAHIATNSFLASAARTADGVSSDITHPFYKVAKALVIVLDITAVSGTSPTLDVVLQAKYGSYYGNLARFAQKVGVGTTLLTLNREIALATEPALGSDLAVGTGLLVQNGMHWLDILRAKWSIGGTTPSFTFEVFIHPIL